jgi:hypothetical protein
MNHTFPQVEIKSFDLIGKALICRWELRQLDIIDNIITEDEIKHKSKVHNSPIYPNTASINNTGLGFEPTSIIIKGGGIDPSVWSLHDLKDGSITDLKTGEVK